MKIKLMALLVCCIFLSGCVSTRNDSSSVSDPDSTGNDSSSVSDTDSTGNDSSSVSDTDPAENDSSSVSDIDYSGQAQAYLEYIDSQFPDRDGGTAGHDKARDWIVAELINAGYPENQISLQTVEDGGQNIILKVPGTGPSADCIVAGAHYDGTGIGDNGSGIALLLAAATGLKKHKLPLTTYFVFFDGEEIGLVGSETFVNELSSEQKESIRYFINTDAIAFGDYCNIYGGFTDQETGEVTGTEIYHYACQLAEGLGFHVYGPDDLNGYFAEHGKGPELDPQGFFTSPWTRENPAPKDTDKNYIFAYSPTTIPASDHVHFMNAGIPYVYFEATNWYMPDPKRPAIGYIGYSDVGDTKYGINGCIMNTEYDSLSYLNENFPGRSLEHFRLYSPLLSKLILEPYSL